MIAPHPDAEEQELTTRFRYPPGFTFWRGYVLVFLGILLFFFLLTSHGVRPFENVAFLIVSVLVLVDIIIVLFLRILSPRSFDVSNSTLTAIWRRRSARFPIPSLSVNRRFRWFFGGSVMVRTPACRFVVFEDLENRETFFSIIEEKQPVPDQTIQTTLD